jgi:hypothetical protein
MADGSKLVCLLLSFKSNISSVEITNYDKHTSLLLMINSTWVGTIKPFMANGSKLVCLLLSFKSNISEPSRTLFQWEPLTRNLPKGRLLILYLYGNY